MDSRIGIYNMSSRTSGTFTKKRLEDVTGRGSTMEECDSTTVDTAHGRVQFQIGEDVYYQEETGQNILGMVGMIQGKKIKIIFGDETDKWAPISRVKKITFSFKDEEEEEQINNLIQAPSSVPTVHEVARGIANAGSKKKSKCDLNGQTAPKENHQVTCGSCGTQKMIAPKKAVDFSPYTSHQYNCRKCINKSKTTKNNGVPIIAAHYLAAARRPRSSDTNGSMTSKGHIMDKGIANGFRSESDICLHCRSQILEKISLHCTMCERPCHPSCLALTPPPLPGDIFWSIICHVCGTQKPDDSPENDSQKLYSSRRSISSWSDVAYLLLSCLGCKHPHEKFFDLDDRIIPFWEENVSKLHLPRQYKTADLEERRKCLLSALSNANLRFLKDDKKKTPIWAIKDHTYKAFPMINVIKPPAVGSGRAVTAAGFPISVRASNPEAASAAMTNIAQTIATQAAANKANGVPTPKNSPSHISPKSSSSSKPATGVVAGTATSTGKKSVNKTLDHLPVAKKTGSEVNSGMQRVKNEIWPQHRFNSIKFLPDLPKTTPNNILGSSTTDKLPPVTKTTTTSCSPGSRVSQSQPPHTPQKHNVTLAPTSGGAARVTGMVITSTPYSPGADGSNRMVNCGSYPVRKNGSPILNRSIRVETVDRKREAEPSLAKPSSLDPEEDCNKGNVIRESPGFLNHSGQRLPVKRKISPIKATIEALPGTSSSRSDPSEIAPIAKKMKMCLPSSTDVTSQRVPSPPKDAESKGSTDSSGNGQKKPVSPLQKLSDLIRNGNGGLTIARITRTESGVLPVTINASALEQAIEQDTIDANQLRDLPITLDKSGQLMSTPTKHGASSSGKESQEENRAGVGHTKEKPVTATSPRAFKLASVSSPGISASSPVLEKRMTRPVRLKRAVVAEAEKQSKESSDTNIKSGKKVNGKTSTVTAAAAIVVKNSRGRPKKPFKLPFRKPNGTTCAGLLGQFNGSVENKVDNALASATVDESEFSWANSTICDLLQYGQGYRLECLPRAPDGLHAKEEMAKSAIKHLKEELTPRPPTYWSTNSTLNHSKKPTNQRSRKELKDLDAYYISGRRIDENGIHYQVVWRDGYGFECSSDEEEDLGVDFGEDYLPFEDYDFAEYFFDKMPVCSDSNNVKCDSNITTEKDSTDSKDGRRDEVFFRNENGNEVAALGVANIKSEPEDSEVKRNDRNRARKWADTVKVVENEKHNTEPLFIDLTDSP